MQQRHKVQRTAFACFLPGLTRCVLIGRSMIGDCLETAEANTYDADDLDGSIHRYRRCSEAAAFL